MEAELAALAASGATTLVGLMVSETWEQARHRLSRFFARDGDENAVAAELRSSRSDMVAARDGADAEAVADIEAAWRARLRRALLSDPEAARELRALLAEIAPSDGAGEAAGAVHNIVSGGVQHGPVLQGGRFSGVSFHGAGRPVPNLDNLPCAGDRPSTLGET
ncbi:hypothetical protein [Streptomyces olivaceus]|uniref:hypothetical protein n=1 Tax=Streptomyces olivaceus TaxID=47716 RepID=UPI001CCFF519|nr:hypothetical protein [Streptomyces olivaceus]